MDEEDDFAGDLERFVARNGIDPVYSANPPVVRSLEKYAVCKNCGAVRRYHISPGELCPFESTNFQPLKSPKVLCPK